jgi:hypothetical protein
MDVSLERIVIVPGRSADLRAIQHLCVLSNQCCTNHGLVSSHLIITIRLMRRMRRVGLGVRAAHSRPSPRLRDGGGDPI